MTGVVSPARNRSWSWSASSRVSSSCSSTASAHSGGVDLLDLGRAHPALGGAGRAAGGAGVLHELARTPVQHAAEVAGLADRPGQRRGPELDLLLDEVHQLQGGQAGTVPLVDDRDHRDAAQRADLEELERLRLEPLAGVDQHHGGVDRGEHPVGVLGEVAVARGVDEVDDVVAVDELQRRRGDRDAAGLLHRHPVRHRGAAVALAVDGARLGDHPGVQGERLGEGRLAGVGVADDGERTAGAGVGHRQNLPPRAPSVAFAGRQVPLRSRRRCGRRRTTRAPARCSAPARGVRRTVAETTSTSRSNGARSPPVAATRASSTRWLRGTWTGLVPVHRRGVRVERAPALHPGVDAAEVEEQAARRAPRRHVQRCRDDGTAWCGRRGRSA